MDEGETDSDAGEPTADSMLDQLQQIKQRKADKRAGPRRCETCTDGLEWRHLRKRPVAALAAERSDVDASRIGPDELHVCRECGRIVSTEEMEDLGLWDRW